MENHPLKNSYLLRLTTILICITLIVFISAKLQVVIVPVIFSLIFSVMLYPIVTKLERLYFPRGVAAFTAIFVACCLLGLMIYFLGNQMRALTQQTPQLKTKLNGLVHELQVYIANHFGVEPDTQAEQIEQQMDNLMENGGKIAGSIIKAIANFVTDVVLIPLFVFFILYFRNFFLEFFHRAFDSTDNKIIDDIMRKMHTVIQSWLVGVLLVMLIVGALNTIGLYFLGIQYAAFFGFLAAFLLVIPYVGIFIGSALPVVMALLTKDSYWYAFGVIGVFWFIQILEANIITPYIVGSKISINPLVALLVLILFGNLWGISGLILALPMTAICKVIFDTIPEAKPYGFLLGEPQKKHLITPTLKFKMKVVKSRQKTDEPVNS
jgi:predicted PurR-regulated permease PerM